jgi:cytoskeletal protein RodZ
MNFGEELRAEREQRGILLDDVSVTTRISLRHLHALESNQFRDLPGGVFNRGIVRSYAKHCGMDEENVLSRFTRALQEQGVETEIKDNDWAQFAEAVRRNRVTDMPQRRLRWLGVLAMLLAVMLLAAGVLWVLVRRGVVQLPQRRHSVSQHAMLLPPERFGIS